jgi:hypothetical protein
LVKKGSKWTIGKKEGLYTTPQPAASHAQPKAAVSQTSHIASPVQSAHK